MSQIQAGVTLMRLGAAAIAFGGMLLPSLSSAQTATGSPAPAGTACVGVLSGEEFPELVPDAYVWNELLTAVERGGIPPTLAIGDRARAAIRQVALTATQRAQKLRGGGGPAEVVPTARLGVPEADVKVAVAHLTVEAREDLIRRIGHEDFSTINAWVEARRRGARYVFDVSGTLTEPDTTGQRRCRVSIVGKDRPDLIPEAYYWETYFRFKSAAAARHRGDGGLFSQEYLQVQQVHHLSMPLGDIQLLLAAASRLTAAADGLRNTANDGSADAHALMRQQIARIVLDGRADLIRVMPDASWAAVQKAADRVRAGTVLDLPTLPSKR